MSRPAVSRSPTANASPTPYACRGAGFCSEAAPGRSGRRDPWRRRAANRNSARAAKVRVHRIGAYQPHFPAASPMPKSMTPKVTIARSPQPGEAGGACDPAHLYDIGGGPENAQEDKGEHGKLPGAEEIVQEEHGEQRADGPIGGGDRAHDGQGAQLQSPVQREIANRRHDAS